MSKLWRIVIVFVLVMSVLVFLYKTVVCRRPGAAVESGTARQVDDGNLSLEQKLAKRMNERAKRADELKDKAPAKIEDKKHTEAERLYNRALLESKMATKRTGDYKRMVDYCRRLLSEYPNSPQATEAKKLLSLIPVQNRDEYNITEEEIHILNSK